MKTVIFFMFEKNKLKRWRANCKIPLPAVKKQKEICAKNLVFTGFFEFRKKNLKKM